MSALHTWHELGDGVWFRRHESATLNVGLVVGAERCLVIDTRLTHRQGVDLAAAVREVTALPWVVVNTHGHFDHCFGNTAFRPADIWGHVGCVAMLEAQGPAKREYFARGAAEDGDHEFSAELAAVQILPPSRTFTDEATVDLGGRSIALRHLGRGHTDNDIVVDVADAGIVFAGDLVEEGDPPAFGDAFPLDWPATSGRVAELGRSTVVPGHGEAVDPAYVTDQAAMLHRTADAAREAHAAGRSVDDAWRDLPLPEDPARTALARAYRQLDGGPPETEEELRQRLGLPAVHA